MPLFKDFNKDVKDLLTKNLNVNEWKLEFKSKAPLDQLFVVPIVENGVMSLDAHFNCTQTGLQTKTRISQDCVFKPEITYDSGDHKLKLKQGGLKCPCSGDGTVIKGGVTTEYEYNANGLSLNDEIAWSSKPVITAGAAYEIAPKAFVGLGLTFDLGKSALTKWSAGARYTHDGWLQVNATYDNKGVVTVGALETFGEVLCAKNVKVATQFATDGSGLTVGTEFFCTVTQGTVRTRWSQKCNGVVVSWAKTLAQNWRFAVNYDVCKKNYGLVITRD
jgi:hypothetical protein